MTIQERQERLRHAAQCLQNFGDKVINDGVEEFTTDLGNGQKARFAPAGGNGDSEFVVEFTIGDGLYAGEHLVVSERHSGYANYGNGSSANVPDQDFGYMENSPIWNLDGSPSPLWGHATYTWDAEVERAMYNEQLMFGADQVIANVCMDLVTIPPSSTDWQMTI